MPWSLSALQNREVHVDDSQLVFGGNGRFWQEVKVFRFEIGVNHAGFMDSVDARYHDPAENHTLVPIVGRDVGSYIIQYFP